MIYLTPYIKTYEEISKSIIYYRAAINNNANRYRISGDSTRMYYACVWSYENINNKWRHTLSGPNDPAFLTLETAMANLDRMLIAEGKFEFLSQEQYNKISVLV